MPTCNVSLQVLPFVEEEELYPIVDKAIEVIKQAGVDYMVGPLETTMEGDLDDLLDVIKEVQKTCLEAGAERMVFFVKIVYNAKGESMDEKVGKYR